MNEKEIYWKLNQHLKIVQNHYPIENIFGIFVIEIGNNEIESEAIVVPTFETICTSISHINTHIEKYITIYDIREVYEATKMGHPEVIQLLETEYKIINPKYEHIFQKIAMCNKDKIKAGVAAGEPADELRIALMKVCRIAGMKVQMLYDLLNKLLMRRNLHLMVLLRLLGMKVLLVKQK